MRAKRSPAYLPSILALQEAVDIDDLVDLCAPEEVETPDALIENRIFEMLKPGHERAIVLFRADGLTYGAIGTVLGLTEVQVRTIIYSIRARLLKQKGKIRLSKL